VQLDRIEIANVFGQTSAAGFEIPQTSIRGLRVALPSSNSRLEVGVASIQIPKTNITAPPSSRIHLDAMTIDDVNVLYDPNRRAVDDIAAHLRLAGMFESNALQSELRHIEFLQGISTRSRVGFDADVRASGPNSPPEISSRFPHSKNLVAVNAGITLKPMECSASFDVATRIQTQSLMLTARADGDSAGVHIRSLRSMAGSPIQIAGGTGSVTLKPAPKLILNLESIGGSLGSTRLDVDSIGIGAAIPAPGKAGIQTAAVAIGPATIRPSSGWDIRIEGANIRFDRMADKRSVPVTFETRIQNVQLEGPDGLITANIPALVTRVSGQASPETIPRSLTGTVDFTALGANSSEELIGSNRPIAFTADLWKGLFDIPEQQITFHEAFLSETRTEIPLQVQLAGRISSIVPRVNADIETKAGLSRFEQATGSARIVLTLSGSHGSLHRRDLHSQRYRLGNYFADCGIGRFPGDDAGSAALCILAADSRLHPISGLRKLSRDASGFSDSARAGGWNWHSHLEYPK
jgi:hypothetical protein